MFKNILAKVKEKNVGQKIFVLAILLVAFIGISRFDFSEKTSASTSDNLYGWAWAGGENVGWISFNCTTDPGGCTKSNYGVRVDLTTGDIDGYAWSDHVGWIKFDSTLSVTGPNGIHPYSAKWNTSNNKITGWAQICGVYKSLCSGVWASNAILGGWQGWISFDCSDGGPTACSKSPYGVSYDPSTGEFSGFAWNGDPSPSADAIGWISFNCKSDPNGNCATSNYSVNGPKVSNTSCKNNYPLCPPPTVTVQIKKQTDPANAYASSVLLVSPGEKVDIKWATIPAGPTYPILSCDLSSDQFIGPWTPMIKTMPANGIDSPTQTVTTATVFTVTCTDGRSIVSGQAVATFSSAPSQSISKVILEAKDSSSGTFSQSPINFPSGSGNVDLRWSVLYSNPNDPGLNVMCDGNQINNNPWISNWSMPTSDPAYPLLPNAKPYGVSGIPASPPPNPISLSLSCYDVNNPGTVISSNIVNVTFGAVPTATLTIGNATNVDTTVTQTPTFVKLNPSGGTVDFKLAGSNLDACLVSSINSASPGSSEDNAWASIGSAINAFLSTNTQTTFLYSTTTINVTRSTTFGIYCQEAQPGTRVTPLSTVKVQVGTIPPQSLTNPSPKYIIF